MLPFAVSRTIVAPAPGDLSCAPAISAADASNIRSLRIFVQCSRGPGLRMATATLAVALAKTATPARSRAATSRRARAAGALPSAFSLLPSAFYLHELSDSRDAHLRADIDEDALRAERIHRPAYVLSPRDEIQIDDRPPATPGRSIERLLRLFRRPRRHPPEPVGDAVHVRVDADVLLAAVGEDQD